MAFTGRVTVFSSLAQVRSAAGCRWCEQACPIDAQVTSFPLPDCGHTRWIDGDRLNMLYSM